MSEVIICKNNNNFNTEKSNLDNNYCYKDKSLTIKENCTYSNTTKLDFLNYSPKEKAIALYYTQNMNTEGKSNSHSSLNSTVNRPENETYPHSQWSNEDMQSDSISQQNIILNDLVHSLKYYNDDISLMIKDLFSSNFESEKGDLALYDIEDFFKYSLIVGQKECVISENIINSLHYLTKCLIDKNQEIQELQEQLSETKFNQFFTNLKQVATVYESSGDIQLFLQKDEFNRECLSQLGEITEQMDNNKYYYQNQIQELLNEIRQRDELLDCYQKRESYLFNKYYPDLITKYKYHDISNTENMENIINEMNQQLEKVEKAFHEKLIIKNSLIEEISNQKLVMEAAYIEKLKRKDETINYLNQQFAEKESAYKKEINHYKKSSSNQVKLAEKIRSEIQNQQKDYCKKIEEMQQSLDSRGKIIAYVQNKLNIRENELKIANIKFTTAERQMNIEKDQYKRVITNLKDELEKTNEDIEDLENELDTQEETLLEEHKEEITRLEKEHDTQLNKLWNIIDQRENTISEMEDQIDELKERAKNLEQSLSKYEKIEKQESEECNIIEEDVNDDMNEKSNITVTGDTSEEIIILEEDCSDQSKLNDQIREDNYNSNVLISNFSNEENIEIEDEKTGVTTEEKFDEANSLTLTEDLTEDSEVEERREFVEEVNEEREELDLEREIRKINEENEQLKRQLEIVNQDNFKLNEQLQQEKENTKQENEKCILQQKECEDLALKYSNVNNEKEEIKDKYQTLENENKKIEKEFEKQATEFQREKEILENQLKQLEISVKNTISMDKYESLQKELEIALENVNEQRRKKNYLKQKLANQHEKNQILVELIKKERVQTKEEIQVLKQSCVKQNGKIKAILKQVKDGLVTAEHIDLDRIVKRMKSERLIMNNEYERLKKVTSSLSIKSSSKKQSFVIKGGGEGFTELPLNYKGSRKDLNQGESVEISIKNSKKSNNQCNENKILIKVAPLESLPDESMVSKKANDSLNSIESIEENQDLEEFNLKKALNHQDNFPDNEEEDQNSFVDFTTPFELNEKKDDDINGPSFNSKESISLILGDGNNKMTPQQVNLYNRILQIPGVVSINANGTRNFEFDDTTFSITSDNSILRESEGYMEKRIIGLDTVSPNRVRYNSFSKNELKGNSHSSLRRMPNFDQIGKLTQIKIKHSTDDIIM